MKRFLIIVLVLVVVGVGFYLGYYRSTSPRQPAGNSQGSAIPLNPALTKEQITPRDTAVNFFQSSAAGDWDKAFTYFPRINDTLKNKIKDYLGGMEVINIGEPYKKEPQFAGMHIPYEIKLKSGEIRKGELYV